MSVAPYGPMGPHWAPWAHRALWPLWSLSALWAHGALWPYGPMGPYWPIGPTARGRGRPAVQNYMRILTPTSSYIHVNPGCHGFRVELLMLHGLRNESLHQLRGLLTRGGLWGLDKMEVEVAPLGGKFRRLNYGPKASIGWGSGGRSPPS